MSLRSQYRFLLPNWQVIIMLKYILLAVLFSYTYYRVFAGCRFLLDENGKVKLLPYFGVVASLITLGLSELDFIPIGFRFMTIIAYSYLVLISVYSKQNLLRAIAAYSYYVSQIYGFFMITFGFLLVNIDSLNKRGYETSDILPAIIIACLYGIVLTYGSTRESQMEGYRYIPNSRIYQLIFVEFLVSTYMLFMRIYISNVHFYPWLATFLILSSIGCLSFLFAEIYFLYIHHQGAVKKQLAESTRKELQQQISEYNQYSLYNQNLREFRHDYKKMMNMVKIMMDEQNYTHAQKLLKQIDERMQRNINENKRFSNNHQLNEKYAQLAHQVQINNGIFECSAFIPHYYNFFEKHDNAYLTDIHSLLLRLMKTTPEGVQRYLSIIYLSSENILTIDCWVSINNDTCSISREYTLMDQITRNLRYRGGAFTLSL